jgi:hypothetical protein
VMVAGLLAALGGESHTPALAALRTVGTSGSAGKPRRAVPP